MIQEVNFTGATLLGVTRNALLYQPISRFIHNEDHDIYYLHCKKRFARYPLPGIIQGSIGKTIVPQECEVRMVKNDGTIFWAHLTASAAGNIDGAPVCSIILTNITVRKRVEAELKASETRYRNLAESIPAMIWATEYIPSLLKYLWRVHDAVPALVQMLAGQIRASVQIGPGPGADFLIRLNSKGIPL